MVGTKDLFLQNSLFLVPFFLATVGSQFVGIASAGIGASMPFFVLTSAGGALLGVLIDEINKSNKDKD